MTLFQRLMKPFRDSFRPYKHKKQEERDYFQLLNGLQNVFSALISIFIHSVSFLRSTLSTSLLYSVLKIYTISFVIANLSPILLVLATAGFLQSVFFRPNGIKIDKLTIGGTLNNIEHWLSNLLKNLNPKHHIKTILENSVDSLSKIIPEAGTLILGTIQIVTSPLTYLFIIPLRLLLTRIYGEPSFLDNRGLTRELRELRRLDDIDGALVSTIAGHAMIRQAISYQADKICHKLRKYKQNKQKDTERYDLDDGLAITTHPVYQIRELLAARSRP